MTDEIKRYHVDDPNDAPERRLCTFSNINPFLPTSLPPYVIPPVANSLLSLHYWYSAYQQGFAVAQNQQQQYNHHQQHHQSHHFQAHRHLHQQVSSPSNSSTSSSHHLSHHQTNHQHHQLHHHQSHHHQAASPSSSLGLTTYSSSSSSSNANAPASSCSSSNNSPSATASPVTSTTPANHLRANIRHHNGGDDDDEDDANDSDNIHLNQYNNDNQQRQSSQQTQQQHIKKPLNPFMIYMQKMRPEIVREGTIKESAAINQLLGQKWRHLSKEEQEPYYKLAEEEKRLHAQKYPGWSARDNYANQKKKKKMKLKSISLNGIDQSDKKCRARFGVHNTLSWCKSCKRKKKCQFAGAK